LLFTLIEEASTFFAPPIKINPVGYLVVKAFSVALPMGDKLKMTIQG
jgi:hypothetical protein